jgi:GR25 family glycosyltransferase involved in LPS biosynthesis
MFQGFFINLAKNSSRRAALVAGLEAMGATQRYQRFEAVDGFAVAAQYETKLDPGNLGCWLSHIGLLQANRCPAQHLHVIEDDTILAHDSVPIFDRLLPLADQRGKWDLIFTDIVVPSDLSVFRQFTEKLQLFAATGKITLTSLQRISFAGTSSFFVNRNSVEKLCGLMADQWNTGLPIDIYIRKLVQEGRLNAFVTLPFLTTVSRHGVNSDIRGNLDRTRMVYYVYRKAFFKDANLADVLAEMVEVTKDARIAPLAAIYREAISFCLSDQYVRF